MDTINANLEYIAQHNEAFQAVLVEKDRRLTTEQDIDLAQLRGLLTAIGECREGICALTWKPTREV